MYFKLLNVKFIQEGASFLLAFLTLFFIPSTVAVINYPELLTKAGVFLIIAVIGSTLLTLVITGKVSQYIEKKENEPEEANDVVTTPSNPATITSTTVSGAIPPIESLTCIATGVVNDFGNAVYKNTSLAFVSFKKAKTLIKPDNIATIKLIKIENLYLKIMER